MSSWRNKSLRILFLVALATNNPLMAAAENAYSPSVRSTATASISLIIPEKITAVPRTLSDTIHSNGVCVSSSNTSRNFSVELREALVESSHKSAQREQVNFASNFKMLRFNQTSSKKCEGKGSKLVLWEQTTLRNKTSGVVVVEVLPL